MDIQGIEPSKGQSGLLVLVFHKIIWGLDAAFVEALQKANVVVSFPRSPRALNTKVIAFPWVVPQTPAEAQAQHDTLGARNEIAEARGIAMSDVAYLDEHGKKVAYLDGGELVVAMARSAPAQLDDVMTYLRAPQRADWFMDPLAKVARERASRQMSSSA